MAAGLIVSILFFTILYSVQDEIIVEDKEADQNPSQYLGFLMYVGFFGPFAIWSLILSIKAVITANGFRAIKSIGVFVAATVANYLLFLPTNLLWN